MGDRVAIDIGGTFTDVVLDAATGQFTTKVLTTHREPAAGVMTGLDKVMQLAGRDAADVELVIHGTTLATNALIERSGAKTALVTTEGHRDALEMAYENRFEQYDINIDRPTPLVPRPLRFTVTERMNGDGEVLVPLDEGQVDVLADTFEDQRIESVAIGLLHGYANAMHELRIAELLEARLPNLSITLASAVCPEIREFERFSTACANAYVRPLMSRYLNDLRDQLVERGFVCPFLMMTSGGGLTTLVTAARYPVRLIESGPAGGAILASRIAAELGLDRVMSFDMGGTTAKICMIDDYAPLLSRAFEVDRSYRFKKGSGLPVRIPVIEMVEIGAGGGSLAKVDKLGRIQVGPESAGSEPGPACYGRGGMQPTVSDADVVMGRLDAGHFAGGTMQLDERAARTAVVEHVANALDFDAVTGAFGITEVVDENMSAAARAHAVEWGKDVAGRAMVAYGGAAPLHAARIAEKLDIDHIIVPKSAGVGSAVGFLIAPVSYEVVRSRYMRLSSFDAALVNETMREMFDEANAVVVQAASGRELTESRRAYMRYVGQGYEIAVDIPAREITAVDAALVAEAFDATYRSLYGRVIPGLDVEVLSWTLTLSTSAAAVQRVEDCESQEAPAPRSTKSMYDPRTAAMLESALYLREDLQPGNRIEGPALIIEAQTTTVVTSGYYVEVNAREDLVLKRVPKQ